MVRRRLPWLALFALVALAAAAGRPAPAASPPELLVAAAADLVFAFREISPAFERAHEAKVRVTLGSTGQLAQQIQHGAPFDVFFAANIAFVEDLQAKQAVRPGSVELYAQGRIVLAGLLAGPALGNLRDLLRPDVRRIAIAHPDHAPYGMAAREAMEKLGIWAQVRPKIVYAENIRQTLQFLQTGNVDAAILALSVADVPEVRSTLIDGTLHNPINQAAAVTARSRQPELARAFIRFVNGPAGRTIMKRYGFLLPREF